jgi:branched-chain amino acid aminotransferase
MRQYLLNTLPLQGYEVREKPLAVRDLETADECFLTNAISGIRWVQRFEKTIFENQLTKELFDKFIV